MEITKWKLGEGRLIYIPVWADDPDAMFAASEKLSFTPERVATQWNPEGKVIKRKTVDYGLTYSYNKTAKPSIEWEKLAIAIRQKLEQQLGLNLVQCACNEYPTHDSYIGPHHDKPTPIGGIRVQPEWIVSLSLGAARKMVLVPPGTDLKKMQPTVNWLSKQSGAITFELAPGSLVVFNKALNMTWKHSIPTDSKKNVSGKRISLTYRQFLTKAELKEVV